MLDVVAEKITRIYPMGRGEVVGVHEIDLEISQGEMVLIKVKAVPARAHCSRFWPDWTARQVAA